MYKNKSSLLAYAAIAGNSTLNTVKPGLDSSNAVNPGPSSSNTSMSIPKLPLPVTIKQEFPNNQNNSKNNVQNSIFGNDDEEDEEDVVDQSTSNEQTNPSKKMKDPIIPILDIDSVAKNVDEIQFDIYKYITEKTPDISQIQNRIKTVRGTLKTNTKKKIKNVLSLNSRLDDYEKCLKFITTNAQDIDYYIGFFNTYDQQITEMKNYQQFGEFNKSFNQFLQEYKRVYEYRQKTSGFNDLLDKVFPVEVVQQHENIFVYVDKYKTGHEKLGEYISYLLNNFSEASEYLHELDISTTTEKYDIFKSCWDKHPENINLVSNFFKAFENVTDFKILNTIKESLYNILLLNDTYKEIRDSQDKKQKIGEQHISNISEIIKKLTSCQNNASDVYKKFEKNIELCLKLLENLKENLISYNLSWEKDNIVNTPDPVIRIHKDITISFMGQLFKLSRIFSKDSNSIKKIQEDLIIDITGLERDIYDIYKDIDEQPKELKVVDVILFILKTISTVYGYIINICNLRSGLKDNDLDAFKTALSKILADIKKSKDDIFFIETVELEQYSDVSTINAAEAQNSTIKSFENIIRKTEVELNEVQNTLLGHQNFVLNLPPQESLNDAELYNSTLTKLYNIINGKEIKISFRKKILFDIDNGTEEEKKNGYEIMNLIKSTVKDITIDKLQESSRLYIEWFLLSIYPYNPSDFAINLYPISRNKNDHLYKQPTYSEISLNPYYLNFNMSDIQKIVKMPSTSYLSNVYSFAANLIRPKNSEISLLQGDFDRYSKEISTNGRKCPKSELDIFEWLYPNTPIKCNIYEIKSFKINKIIEIIVRLTDLFVILDTNNLNLNFPEHDKKFFPKQTIKTILKYKQEDETMRMNYLNNLNRYVENLKRELQSNNRQDLSDLFEKINNIDGYNRDEEIKYSSKTFDKKSLENKVNSILKLLESIIIDDFNEFPAHFESVKSKTIIIYTSLQAIANKTGIIHNINESNKMLYEKLHESIIGLVDYIQNPFYNTRIKKCLNVILKIFGFNGIDQSNIFQNAKYNNVMVFYDKLKIEEVSKNYGDVVAKLKAFEPLIDYKYFSSLSPKCQTLVILNLTRLFQNQNYVDISLLETYKKYRELQKNTEKSQFSIGKIFEFGSFNLYEYISNSSDTDEATLLKNDVGIIIRVGDLNMSAPKLTMPTFETPTSSDFIGNLKTEMKNDQFYNLNLHIRLYYSLIIKSNQGRKERIIPYLLISGRGIYNIFSENKVRLMLDNFPIINYIIDHLELNLIDQWPLRYKDAITIFDQYIAFLNDVYKIFINGVILTKLNPLIDFNYLLLIAYKISPLNDLSDAYFCVEGETICNYILYGIKKKTFPGDKNMTYSNIELTKNEYLKYQEVQDIRSKFVNLSIFFKIDSYCRTYSIKELGAKFTSSTNPQDVFTEITNNI